MFIADKILSIGKFINKKKHIFKKYNLYTLFLNIFSLYLFSKMVEDVIYKESIIKLDVLVNAKIVLLWSPLLNKIMIFVTNILSHNVLFIASMLLLGFFVYRKKWLNSLLLIFGLSGGSLLVKLVKSIIHRARPENSLIEVSGYSFPSGHAALAIIFFSLLLYLFKEYIKNKILKNIFIAANIALFLLIGFSRIYLNVHWLSDVIAGFALGLFWLTLLILIFEYRKIFTKTL